MVMVQENPEEKHEKKSFDFLEIFFGILFSEFFFSLPSLPQKNKKKLGYPK
jgi:hypothetical protein